MNHDLRLTAEKIGKRIELIRPEVIRAKTPLAPFRFEQLDRADAAPGSGFDRGEVAWNSYWAGQNTHFVLRGHFELPAEYSAPALHLPLGVAGDIFTHPEAILYIDDQLIASADRYHQIVSIDTALADGNTHTLMLYGWTGLTGWPPDRSNTEQLQIKPCSVVDLDNELRRFVALAEIALDLATSLDRGNRTRERILHALDVAFVTLDTRHPLQREFRESVPVALGQLVEALQLAGAKSPETLHAIGHAHMDIAYLWPIAQIRQKNARTGSNVLRLMDKYPQFRFSHSQPQLYAYMEADFPDLFERVRQRVAEGRWEVMGGMWVEADCNIPGGESLARQILLGRNYFRERFGDAETPVLWLPDTFGFPWTLPQLMQQAGIDTFISNKLSWNQYNRMPSSSTWWQGLDGTRVLSHFLTTPRPVQHLPFPTNYKSDLSVAEVCGTFDSATTGPEIDSLPIAYGYGDGGGGPNEDLLLKAEAYASLPAVPELKMSTVRDAVADLRSRADRLPVWSDELYLEGHRGTLTSQAWIKRANRKVEQLLHDTEVALVMALPAGCSADDRATLQTLWRLLCLNQFHDIVTGTSVPEVFVDARADFLHLQQTAIRLRDRALGRLTVESAGKWSVFNPSPVVSSGVVLVPNWEGSEAEDGQAVEGGSLRYIQPVAAYSIASLTQGELPKDMVTVEETDDGIQLDNGLVQIFLTNTGDLSRIYDYRKQREVLAPGQLGNQIWAYEDRPISWDAWDIDVFHDERAEMLGSAARVEVVERGPLRTAVQLIYNYRGSRIEQTLQLTAGSARIDFLHRVDWHEKQTLLKVAFPVDVLAPRATYEIQWGEIERPTHRNTTWDFARFEVPAQKWASLHEGDFGAALLNDCKYGHAARDNVLALTLIKSSTSPDPEADQGEHVFTYSLLPHDGDLSTVRAEARRLNDPVIVVAGDPKPAASRHALVSCDDNNIIIETVKPAENGDGFVVRLYEAARRRGPVTLRFGPQIEAVSRCDFLEQPGESLRLDNNQIALSIKPFEIVSLRCWPEPST